MWRYLPASSRPPGVRPTSSPSPPRRNPSRRAGRRCWPHGRAAGRSSCSPAGRPGAAGGGGGPPRVSPRRSAGCGGGREPAAVVLAFGHLVVGMASGVHYVHPDRDPELFVNEVGVAETHRGRGVGRRLVAPLLAVG